MKADPYKLEQRFNRWKKDVLAEGIPGLSKTNSEILLQHVLDMEAGRNVSRYSKKGGRSHARLCNITQRMSQLLRMFENRGILDIRQASEHQITQLFSDMERGVLRTHHGRAYKSGADYASVFKAFWHWWMKVNRKQGIAIADMTEDISTRGEKPRFVYLAKPMLDRLLPYFERNDQLFLLFLFDSLVRPPTEVLSLRASHVYEQDGEVWVSVPDEVSKTFGRSFNLLFCGGELLAYIRRHKLGPDDQLFALSPPVINRRLQAAARQEFGDQSSHPRGDLYKNITMYDLRHSGAIHLRILANENPGLISLDAIRHRAGWTNLTMLNYYTEFIGIDGKINKQGMLLRQDTHRLEEDVARLKRELKEVQAECKQLVTSSREALDLFEELKNQLGTSSHPLTAHPPNR